MLDLAEFLTHKRQLPSATSSEVDSEGDPAPQPSAPQPTVYVPKTPLGKRLWELRQQAIAAGMKLLIPEEIEQEIRNPDGPQPNPWCWRIQTRNARLAWVSPC